jgi:peptidyl-prolyl cis-trans isomerase C
VKSNILIAVALGLAPLGLALSGPAALAQTASGTGDQPASETAGEAAGGYSVDSPVATVDGVALTLGELITIRRQLPDQYQGIPDDVLMKGLSEQMIDQMLLSEAGMKAGLDQRPSVALNLLVQQRAILADAYLRAEIQARATPEAVEALYQERYANAEPEDEVRAAHILVESEEKAKELKAQLDGGADFAALAAEHGTDGTASRGGDLGWFVHSEMVPEFADAAFGMEPGTVSAPVQTSFGWHLIKLDERRPRKVPELEEVRGDLLRQLVEKLQVDIVQELRDAATIVMPDPPVPAQAIRDDAMVDAAR